MLTNASVVTLASDILRIQFELIFAEANSKLDGIVRQVTVWSAFFV